MRFPGGGWTGAGVGRMIKRRNYDDGYTDTVDGDVGVCTHVRWSGDGWSPDTNFAWKLTISAWQWLNKKKSPKNG